MHTMKGIILAGGKGTRLHPTTKAVSKQLLPIYDKPLIYYPLATLVSAGIRDIAIITAPDQQLLFQKLLGDGLQWGISLTYLIQDKPRGIAESFLLAAYFIGEDKVCLILGDNIFYGHDFRYDATMFDKQDGAVIFGHYVMHPQRYGVVRFDNESKIHSIIEKPRNPPSNIVVTGIYMYDNNIVNITKGMKPSARGELEITDVNNYYLNKGILHLRQLARESVWFDAGTYGAMVDASNYIRAIDKRQGLKLGCVEEAAYNRGFIGGDELIDIIHSSTDYKHNDYLKRVMKGVW